MKRSISLLTFVLMLAIGGCDSTMEPIAQNPSQSTETGSRTSLAKRGWGNNHDRNCDRNHDNDEDCNSRETDHERDCDGYHQRNSDQCNHDRQHTRGCRRNHDYDEPCTGSTGGTSVCDNDGIVTLWAGKNTNVGTVSVAQVGNSLVVTYATSSTWKLKETHLDISTSQYTQRGAPGQYDYQSTHNNITTYTYTIPNTWASGTKLYFLAHAVVGKTSYNSCGSTETAYGGTVISPQYGSWYATFCYTLKGTTPPPTYSLSGVAFKDANSNGTQDVGEAGLANVAVSLSTGANAVTDANGAYSFAGLVNGSYTVSAGAVSSYNATTASSVPVTIAGANASANFGYVFVPPTYSISGYVFVDLNLNGIFDAGEAGVPGNVVTLNGSVTTTTDANGYWSFSGLLPSTYSIVSSPVVDMNLTTSPTVKVIITNANGSGNFGWAVYSIPDRSVERARIE